MSATTSVARSVVGQPEVLDELAQHPAWLALKSAATELQGLQQQNGSLSDDADRNRAAALVDTVTTSIRELAPFFPHDAAYLDAVQADFASWVAGGFAEPDFYDSIAAFAPAAERRDGVGHLVVFPMYTQNGSRNRFVEAVLVEVMWPDFIAELEATEYGNAMFLPLRFIDFTPGYDTNSAVLFPETVAMRAIPTFTWGAIFQDREAARFRRVLGAAADITKLELPEQAKRMLDDQKLTERAFIMWDLIHDRTHMRGDLPFDPFMIKQRMPYFLYTLEELRCDLTAFRESVRIERRLAAKIERTAVENDMLEHAKLVQFAVLFDRIFRFAITGTRTRNYDAVGGQLLFAWLHQRGVLQWTDVQLTCDWDALADAVVELSDAIDGLYWASIDRPKMVHWLEAYKLVSGVLAPHPASHWAKGLPQEVLEGPASGYTDLVLDDEFPLSMFFEALEKKMRPVIESMVGITPATV